MKHPIHWFALLSVLLLACSAPAAEPAPAPIPTPLPTVPQAMLNALRVGWAYEAYPETSLKEMRAAFRTMRDAGANALWIGHNNPGQVDADKVEPGMSYAVYAALQNADDPRHADAQKMSDAVKRALDAARETQLQVILPIGYQIQMGDAWNELHPNALRLTYDGQPLRLYNSGVTASPYSEQYRADITRYYEWIQRAWVEPYAGVIVMLSLADEPMGGDYSDAAKQAFLRRYGKSIDAVSEAEVWQAGEFQAGVIADYAAWSANAWQKINPNILTTMSFHGGDTARRVWGLPEIEKLFSETPPNFVVTFDAYLHDDLPTKAANDDEAAQLKLFLNTLGALSQAYHKPIALWGGANAWGLAQESSAPRGIPDAVTNLLLLYDLPARTGGAVWGVFAWNYNVKEQGLYNYGKATTYAPQNVELAVHRAFPLLRTRAPAPARTPEVAILYAPRTLYRALAESHNSDVPPDWFDTTAFARTLSNRRAVLVSTTAARVLAANANYLFVTAPNADLDAGTLDFLREQFARGQILFGEPALARALGTRIRAWDASTGALPEQGGVLYALPAQPE